MALKILFPPKLSFSHFIVILILFFSSISAHAQCAGNDNAITVCDIPNSSSQSIDLFGLLGGGAVVGGTWTDDLFSGGLNLATGILNAQIIKNSGVYTYTYTSNMGCGDNSSIITVTIGGYSGVPSSTAKACSDDASFNLFQVFNGTALRPQFNGIWSDDDGTGALSGNFLNAKIAGLGTRTFTYTMPAIGTCPSQSSTVKVTVARAPEPGTPTPLLLCNTDLASYTNLDLNSRLTGADPGGIWTESGTSELSGIFDSTINVQNIYTTLGPGKYSFTYTVFPDDPVCNIKEATVDILIEKQLDFTGATLVVNSDICENEIATASYSAILTQVNQLTQNIPNGIYEVTYTIPGAAGPITSTSNFVNGVLTFNINRIYFPQVGDYTVKITNIVNKAFLGICSNIIGSISDDLHVYLIPQINDATLAINPVCKGSGAAVEISGNTNLTDGNYRIDYNLSGSNTAVAQQSVFSVTSGVGNFAIPANLIPIDGKTTITITKITNLTGCSNTSTLSKEFVIKPLVVLPSFSMVINNVCQNQPVVVSLSGLGTLTNVTLNYDLTGTNSVMNQTATLAVNSGNAGFTIPAASLVNAGNTTLVVTSIIDNGGGCGVQITNGPKSFTINAVPNVPIATGGIFCKSDNKTIADLSPSGIQYQWFDSMTSTTVLSASTLLVSGNYYVKEVNATTGCESGRAMANVIINDVQAPTLNQDGQNFCALDNPILQNLTDRVTTNGTLSWFDAPTNGSQFASTALLKDGFTYYGFDYSSATDCYSSALEVTVSLSDCDETPGFFIPDGFSPNGDTVNDSFRIPDIEFIYPNYTLEIYNRYGNLMFTGNIHRPEWDGKSSDANIAIDGFAPNGVYFYVIKYNRGNKSPKQGRLYLNR